MESVKKYQIDDFVFDEKEDIQISSMVEEVISIIKKNNPTFAEAREVLKRCRIELETLKIKNEDKTKEPLAATNSSMSNKLKNPNDTDNDKINMCISRFISKVCEAMRKL